MKQLSTLLLLLILLSTVGYSQIYQSNKGYGWEYNRFKIDSVFTLPTISDTTQAPPTLGRYQLGALATYIGDSTTREWNGSYWRKISGTASGTNLSSTTTTTTVNIQSSTGTPTTLSAATQMKAGVMTMFDKIKLDSIYAVADTLYSFTGTASQIRALSGKKYPTVFLTGTYGGQYNYISSDVSSADDLGSTLVTADGRRYRRQYSGYVNAGWFGLVGDGVTDNAPMFQAAVNFCFKNTNKPKTLYIPLADSTYITRSDIVINFRNSSVVYNGAKFTIIGEQGGSSASSTVAGVVINRKGARGAIFRICEEADGSYPGGGKDSVIRPLNFVRTVDISNINFSGQGSDTSYTISGIVGRSIDRSIISKCGFTFLNYGIRLGKAGMDVPVETSLQEGVTLDYCERNTIEYCTFDRVRKHIFILSPDLTTINNNSFNTFPNTNDTNFVLYWASGNDFLTFTQNLVHTNVAATSTQIPKSIRCYSTRGAKFIDNHMENICDTLFSLSVAENIQIKDNLINTSSSLNVFVRATMKEYSYMDVSHNIIAIPTPMAVLVNGISDDGSFTKLKTITVKCKDNKGTTGLGGATPVELSTNVEALNILYGQTFSPQRIGSNYLWSGVSGELRTKTVASGKPTTTTSGEVLATTSTSTLDNYYTKSVSDLRYNIQQVLTAGNSTTNSIAFTGGTNGTSLVVDAGISHYKILGTTSIPYARGLSLYPNSGSGLMASYGFYGAGNQLFYGYMGKSHDNATIKWDTLGNVAIGLTGATVPDTNYKADIYGKLRTSDTAKLGKVQVTNTAGTGTRIVTASSTGVFTATVNIAAKADTTRSYTKSESDAILAATVTGSTYTPTVTGASSYTPRLFYYTKVGNIVHVSGSVAVTAIGATGHQSFTINLPVASTISATTDVTGVVTGLISPSPTTGVQNNYVNGYIGGNGASVNFSTDELTATVFIQFSYIIH